MSLVLPTSLIFTKTVKGNPLTGSYGSKVFVTQVSSETMILSNIRFRSDPESLEQVATIESHWIADVSINCVMVHRYQC